MNPVRLDRIGELRIQGSGYLSSGSGLASVGDHLYVVPDDDLYVGRFPAALDGPGDPVPIFNQAPLPEDVHERKKAKPDMESLSRVPPSLSGLAGTALLSLGSGSTENRRRGVLLPVESSGAPVVFSLEPLYEALQGLIPGLNIEGVAVSPEVVRLVQRGDSEQGVNAVIDLDPQVFFHAIQDGRPIPAAALRHIRRVDLGSLPSPTGPVPLTFTDLTTTPKGGFIFTASAEQTTNAYDDGLVLGSAVGRLNADGSIQEMRRLDTDQKIEGIDAAGQQDGSCVVRLVSDPDDPRRAAELFRIIDPEWLVA